MNDEHSMSHRLVALEDGGEFVSEPKKTLDALLTKLIWERALKSQDDEVFDAVKNLWAALKSSEK